MEHETIRELRREVRRLKLLVAGAGILLGGLGLTAFLQVRQSVEFEEISVERINIVESDGKLRMVLSNRSRSPGPIAYGKPFGYPGGNRPGIIFFNDEETENGGLTFQGQRGPDGKVRATGHLSFDQYNQDQVIYMQYSEQGERRRMGLTVADRANVPILDVVALQDSIQKMPEGPQREEAMARFLEPLPGEPLAAQRVFVGRDYEKNAMLLLSDKFGKPRVRLVVDSLGAASLDFLDAEGRVTHSVPDKAGRYSNQ